MASGHSIVEREKYTNKHSRINPYILDEEGYKEPSFAQAEMEEHTANMEI
jgi:hypothetical protein